METIAQKYFEEYTERFNTCTDAEIILAFNKEVGVSGWGTARASYIAAIHSELDRRKFDYTELGDVKSLSFKYHIILDGMRIKKRKFMDE